MKNKPMQNSMLCAAFTSGRKNATLWLPISAFLANRRRSHSGVIRIAETVTVSSKLELQDTSLSTLFQCVIHIVINNSCRPDKSGWSDIVTQDDIHLSKFHAFHAQYIVYELLNFTVLLSELRIYEERLKAALKRGFGDAICWPDTFFRGSNAGPDFYFLTCNICYVCWDGHCKVTELCFVFCNDSRIYLFLFFLTTHKRCSKEFHKVYKRKTNACSKQIRQMEVTT